MLWQVAANIFPRNSDFTTKLECVKNVLAYGISFINQKFSLILRKLTGASLHEYWETKQPYSFVLCLIISFSMKKVAWCWVVEVLSLKCPVYHVYSFRISGHCYPLRWTSFQLFCHKFSDWHVSNCKLPWLTMTNTEKYLVNQIWV